MDSQEDMQNYFRRQQQRAYVDFLGSALNPSKEKNATGSATIQRSDAVLFLEQHLDKVEDYLKLQQADGLDAAHYRNLLLRVKKIRERYESGL